MKKIVMTAVIGVVFLMLIGCENTYITSAKVYIQQQQYEKAVEMCQTAIAQTPDNPDAYFVLGKSYSLMNKYLEMEKAFKKSEELSAKNAQEISYHRNKAYKELFDSARQLSNNDKPEEAIVKYEMATEILPKRYEAYMNLAVTYLQAEKDSMAVVTYKRAMVELPDSMRFAYNLGLTYYNHAEYEKAAESFNQVVEKVDNNSDLYFEALFNMANAYAMLKQEDKALDIYKQALEKDPENTMILFNMGRMLLLQEKYEEAIDIFKKVVEKTPDDYDANFTIGNAYLQINNKLIDEFNQVRDKLSESESKARKDAMDVNFKNALPYFEKARDLNPENSNVWFYLGTIYVRLGDTAKGQEAFDKSDELKSQGK
jgi:tetratricopeptide (TPR) repeat protein